jgi:hypothetical protein
MPCGVEAASVIGEPLTGVRVPVPVIANPEIVPVAVFTYKKAPPPTEPGGLDFEPPPQAVVNASITNTKTALSRVFIGKFLYTIRVVVVQQDNHSRL